jgi:glutamine synthetase
MEARFPDACCNPYLAFSVLLAAGLDGVDKATPCPEPMTVDLYKLTAMEREEMNVGSLPHDLYEAAQVAERSDWLREAVGDDLHSKLIETKIAEADMFRLYVSPMDLERHMVL